VSSRRRKMASRANGARSKGPITPAGKARSSRNATRHGLMAKCVVLEDESREGFDTLLAEFIARFGPTDGVELGLVEEMFSAFWRQRRAWAIETRTMDNAISTQPPDQDELARLTGAFTAVAAQPPLELLHRYETRLHRIFQRALANLILMRSLQELNPPAENTGLQNDPSPITGQLAPPESGPSEIPPEPAVEPTPPPENSELPNDPSPISGHLVQSVMRTHGDSSVSFQQPDGVPPDRRCG
jgi:hypothetical protein